MSDEDGSPTSSVSELSEFKKGQIVGAYLGGLSVKDVSQMCNVTCQTVSEILHLYKSVVLGLKRSTGPGKAVNTRKRRKKAETRNGGNEKKITESKEARQEDSPGNKQSSHEKDTL
uniref:Uncharacterized protein n=1 Tax=Neogobius melanostomus TaxID=47308 RepID=A0A8C6TKC6_9GOBI